MSRSKTERYLLIDLEQLEAFQIHNRGGGPGRLIVFMAIVNLCRFRNSREVVWTGKWSKPVRMRRQTVYSHLNALEKCGLIVIDRERGKFHRIHLTEFVPFQRKAPTVRVVG